MTGNTLLAFVVGSLGVSTPAMMGSVMSDLHFKAERVTTGLMALSEFGYVLSLRFRVIVQVQVQIQSPSLASDSFLVALCSAQSRSFLCRSVKSEIERGKGSWIHPGTPCVG